MASSSLMLSTLGISLGDPIHVTIGNIQRTTDITYDGPRLHLAESDDLGYLVTSIFFHHIADNLVSSLRTEVGVDIRHADPIRIEKTFKKKIVSDGIDTGNP